MDFNSIAVLLVFAAASAAGAKLLKQPLLVGYLFAGFILSFLGIVTDIEVFSGLGQVGVALLLFLVGVEMKLDELPTIGKVAAIAGFSQIAVTSAGGFLISRFILGYGVVTSVYIAIALSFSSTIIVIKLLSEKKDLGSLYGKISVGLLLIQDFVAIIVLMFLAGLRHGGLTGVGYGLLALKGFLLIVATWILSKKVIPYIFDKFLASSSELLFISSVAWALGLSAFVGGPLGFTLEIGGFLAGLSLSNLPEHLQIASRTRPLRDFFLTIFFMTLGTKLIIGNLAAIILPSAVFSLFVLVGNPLVIIMILGFMGFTRRTSFLAGLTVAQISEFSLIMMSMGLALGHVTENEVTLVIVVAVVTMTISTYLILGADKIFKHIKKYLRFFERKSPRESAVNKDIIFKDHVVLIGADRTGRSVINFLRKKKVQFVVVDFNPNVFRKLTADNVPCIFGDISDSDIFSAAGVADARLVLSTISNLPANLYLLENIRRLNRKPLTMFTVTERADGIKLYEKKADYVIVPQRVAGEHIRHVLSTYGISAERIKKLGKSNFNRLISV